jgi:hypothetical protein
MKKYVMEINTSLYEFNYNIFFFIKIIKKQHVNFILVFSSVKDQLLDVIFNLINIDV